MVPAGSSKLLIGRMSCYTHHHSVGMVSTLQADRAQVGPKRCHLGVVVGVVLVVLVGVDADLPDRHPDQHARPPA